MVSILGELIVSRYIAESVTTDAGHFSHVGLCQLHTEQFCPQLARPTGLKHPAISCY